VTRFDLRGDSSTLRFNQHKIAVAICRNKYKPTAPSCRGSNQRSAKKQSKGEATTHESPHSVSWRVKYFKVTWAGMTMKRMLCVWDKDRLQWWVK